MDTPVVTVRDLHHAFGEGELRREVIHGVSVDFHAGDICIIVGPSGSGKTTFLTLVGSLRSVQDGSIMIEGRELRGMPNSELVEVRRSIGFIFQAHNLIESLTACENVQMSMSYDKSETAASSRKKALAMLKEVGLEDHADKKPHQLSGGQKQRVAIARALVREPTIIMADEPTAALDKQSGREVVNLLERLARQMKCTILLVTHDNRILDVADRIVKLEDGEMEETHLGMERIMKELEQLFEITCRMIAASDAEDDSLQKLHDEFVRREAPLDSQVADLIHRNMREDMASQAAVLHEILGHIRSLDSSIFEFAQLMHSHDASPLQELSHLLEQSAEFLMLTAGDAVRNRTIDDVDILLNVSGDRGDAMQRIRERTFETQASLPDEQQAVLFDLTNGFVRIVFHLNHLGVELKKWCKSQQ